MRRVVAARLSLRLMIIAGLLVGFAPPALAANETICRGSMQHRAVVGDLRVQTGEICRLKKVSVSGSVIVEGTSMLQMKSVSIGSVLMIGRHANAYTKWTTVRGDLILDRAKNVTITRSTLVRSVVGSVAQLFLSEVQINGRVGVIKRDEVDRVSGVSINEATIGQGVRVDGLSMSLFESQISKYLIVDQTIPDVPLSRRGRASICSTRVAGDVTLKLARSPLIGVMDHGYDCGGRVKVDGSLLLLGSTGNRPILNAAFGGQLVCRQNSLLPKAGPTGVTASGFIQQCAGLRPV